VPVGVETGLDDAVGGALEVLVAWALALGELLAVEGAPPQAENVRATTKNATALRRTAVTVSDRQIAWRSGIVWSGGAGSGGAGPLSALVAVGVLDDRQHARRDEPRGADNTACAGHLANLHRCPGAANFHRPAGLGRLDDVLTRGARPGVHQDLDKITFSHACFTPNLTAN